MNFQELMSQSKAIEFKLDALDVLRGPGVYLFVRGDEPIYCGCSKKVVGRILARNHHEVKHLAESDGLLIFPCKDYASARQLESEMITALRPKNNRRNYKLIPARNLAQALGMSTQAVIAAYLRT